MLDNFNRANEGPPPSANWSTDIENVGALGLKVVSNACTDNAGSFSDGWWNASQFGPDSEVYATLATVAYTRLNMRIQSPGTSGCDGYYLDYNPGSSFVKLFRIDNAVETQLGATEVFTVSNGESLGAEAIGSTLTAYRKSGSWASLFFRTDSTYGGSGYLGLTGQNSVVYDDFGGGTVVAAVTTLASDTPMPIMGRGATW